ncbi:hypothetical protein [Mycobacterium tuberculosis]|uniref:hypothetical protein n=1 Tax=Mycobacterium tuberculosis TaxID=1773 RepID=UPI0027121646|nr:hypothetical protein [Mycobacterium tuberculosis]
MPIITVNPAGLVLKPSDRSGPASSTTARGDGVGRPVPIITVNPAGLVLKPSDRSGPASSTTARLPDTPAGRPAGAAGPGVAADTATATVTT